MEYGIYTSLSDFLLSLHTDTQQNPVHYTSKTVDMNTIRSMRADPEHVSGRRKGIFKDLKNDVIAMCAEFVGTVLFLLVALGVSLSSLLTGRELIV